MMRYNIPPFFFQAKLFSLTPWSIFIGVFLFFILSGDLPPPPAVLGFPRRDSFPTYGVLWKRHASLLVELGGEEAFVEYHHHYSLLHHPM